jgi:DNA-binding MarR family transcriptional regulator
MSRRSGPDSGPLLSPGFWLHHAALAWRAELDARLAPLGLTPTQFFLLGSVGWLERVAGPPTQQQVADQSGADRTMASKVLSGLRARGYLIHQIDPDDARAYRLRLTPEGRKLVSEAAAIARAVDADFFGADAAPMRARLRDLAERRVRPARSRGG